MDCRRPKGVFTIVEGPPPAKLAYWVRIGMGTMNPDGSLALKLEALPSSGQIHVRDEDIAPCADRPTMPRGRGGRAEP